MYQIEKEGNDETYSLFFYLKANHLKELIVTPLQFPAQQISHVHLKKTVGSRKEHSKPQNSQPQEP